MMKRMACIIAICVGALSNATPALADITTLNFVAAATGEDTGPQDGVFDQFVPFNLGSVNNNGWTSFRTAFEFDLSGIPAGATIVSAQLIMDLSNFDGTRTIELHGYAGDGTVQLADLARNGSLAKVNVDASGTQRFTLDVTSFVGGLAASSQKFAGFNVREEPANDVNYGVMNLEGVAQGYFPRLSVEFSPEQRVDIDIKPGSDPNSVNLCSKGVLPVAILGSADFDATRVDPETVRLADAAVKMVGKSGKHLCHVEDVNGDGLPDLTCQVVVSDMAVDLGITDTQVKLRAQTTDGTLIWGTDSINVVKNCEGGASQNPASRGPN